MTFKKGEGGRKKGSKNKLTLARLQMREEALRRLNEELPEDSFKGDSIQFFQRIYRDPNFDPQLRLEAAARLAQFERKEASPDSEPRYVAIMPWPVRDLDEWRRRYMEVAPDADPIEVERLEKIAKGALDADKDRSIPPRVTADEKDRPVTDGELNAEAR